MSKFSRLKIISGGQTGVDPAALDFAFRRESQAPGLGQTARGPRAFPAGSIVPS